MNRRWILCLLCLLCLTASSSAEYIVSPNSAPVHMRKSPSTSSSVVTSLVTGTEVTVLTPPVTPQPSDPADTKKASDPKKTDPGENPPDTPDWSYVDVDGRRGFVKTEFLSETDPLSAIRGTHLYVLSPNSAPVNFRKRPGGRVLGRLVTGTEVQVLSEDKGWTQISYDGNTGFVKTAFLVPQKPLTGYEAWITSANGGKVRLREGAGTTYGVVTRLSVGTRIEVLSEDAGWARVHAGKHEGYVDSQYITPARVE